MKDKLTLKPVACAATLFLLFAARPAFAQNIDPKLAGFLFRSLAKAYVVTQDMGNMKNQAIDKIIKMDEKGFRGFYLDFYEHVYDFRFFVSKYNIRKDMTKNDAVQLINSLDKRKICEIIDAVPDYIVAREFKRYVSYAGLEGDGKNKTEQFSRGLSNLIEKVKRKYLQ